MLELLLLLYLLRKLSKLVEAKNRSPWLLWLLPVFWFGLEVLFGGLVYILNQDNPAFTDFHAYGIALLGGILGAGIAFGFVEFLPRRPLKCPECDWQFTEHGPIGVECKQCGTWLRVTRGKVYRI